MEIEGKDFEYKRTCCGDTYLYRLGFDAWMCGNCLLNELMSGRYKIEVKDEN